MDTSLAAAYARCRELHKRYGRSYYLATRLLPEWKRRHVHALYGFARYADEIVDAIDGRSPAEQAARLADWSGRFLAGLRGEPVHDPLLPAVLHTIAVFGLDSADFESFLRSMAMDLKVTSYPSYDDLLGYMEGSAAVIGTLMLPILGTHDPAAREPARQLGLAFQLTNFIRDVAEDLDRGRTYLPDEDLATFGLIRDDLVAAADRRTATPSIRALIEYEVTRAQSHYAAAAAGLSLLAPASRACIRTAYAVYGGILDEVAAAGYDVFARRVVVRRPRRAALAVRALMGAPVVVPGPSALLTDSAHAVADRRRRPGTAMFTGSARCGCPTGSAGRTSPTPTRRQCPAAG